MSQVRADGSRISARPPSPGASPGSAGEVSRPLAIAQDTFISGAWDRKSYLPPANQRQLPDAEALAKGRATFSISVAQGKSDAERVGAFFKRYPSAAANQILFFHSYWAQNETFQKLPLQAYLYHTTMPIDAQGRPKNALWQAYVRAIEDGKPQAEIETAYLRAHIQEFKDVVRPPEFKQLYALATPKYRQIVEAYLDTLQELEGRLNRGEDPNRVSRNLFFDTTRWLAKRGVTDLGFMASLNGVKAELDPAQPLTRQLWSSLGGIFSNRILGSKVEEPAPIRVEMQLSAAEAKELAAATGIPFKPGSQSLTPDMLKNASVAELPRGNPQGPLPRYPLSWDDFIAFQKLHPDQRKAGADGVMRAEGVRGVIRDVRARVRSNMVEGFFGKYPTPESGILQYSANMLAMNGTYGYTKMFDTLANAVMPVDNEGKPKNALWQAYADAYEQHLKTGAPSMEALETLWFKAHMNDFAIVDSPEFQQEWQHLKDQAAADPALKPMVVYSEGAVGGRQLFEQARARGESDEACFLIGLRNFQRAMVETRSVPFLKQDVQEAGRYLAHRDRPPFDDRGLPTDETMFARAAEGLRDMTGLTRVAGVGLKETLTGDTVRQATGTMIDFSKVLSPDQLKRVDKRVLDFYLHPTRYDVTASAGLPGTSDRVVLGDLAPVLSGLGHLPANQGPGHPTPIEQDLYRDAQGGTHWDRYAVVDGHREPLFLARFEAAGKQLRETFSVRGAEVSLYFNVEPYQGGLRLTLDRAKSSELAASSNITFTTLPNGNGVSSTGEYADVTGLLHGVARFEVKPKAALPD